MSGAERQRRRRDTLLQQARQRDQSERELIASLNLLRRALGKTWKEQTRNLLCLRDWIEFKLLFEAVQAEIPLHFAFRQAARDGNPNRGITPARLRLFQNYLNLLKVVKDPPGRGYDYRHTKVRLPRTARQRQKFERLRDVTLNGDDD
jgi:hypothetical protein